jgi:hypothetical protein
MLAFIRKVQPRVYLWGQQWLTARASSGASRMRVTFAVAAFWRRRVRGLRAGSGRLLGQAPRYDD